MNEQPINNGFGVLLSQMRKGQSHDELSRRLAEVVQAVQETGKAGSISYTVKVKPATKGNGVAVIVEDDIKHKLPQGDRTSIFFATEDGQLSRNDPNQQELRFQSIQGEQQEAVETDQAQSV